MFYIKTKDLEERTRLIRYLKEREINAVFHYIPLHSAPAGRRYGEFRGQDIYTTKESERLLRLPLYYGMEPADRERVVEAVTSFYKK
jgi:dTDP-4-amino-4,6-dideoxygalactose transaminase